MIREEETKTKKKRRDVSRTKTTKKKNNSSTPASSSSSSSTFARKLSLKKLCASSSLSLSLVWNNRSLLVCERFLDRFLFSVLNPKSNFLFPFFLSCRRISLQIFYIKQCAYAQTRRVIQSSRAGESFQRETEKERERESVCVCVREKIR